MARFDKAIALANKLITKNGGPIVLRSFSGAAGSDPAKPWKPGTNVPTDQNTVGVFLNYEQKYISGFRSLGVEVGADTIRTGDQSVLMPANDLNGQPLTPGVEGIVLRGTQVWKIITVNPLNPNGQSVMFELQVRQ